MKLTQDSKIRMRLEAHYRLMMVGVEEDGLEEEVASRAAYDVVMKMRTPELVKFFRMNAFEKYAVQFKNGIVFDGGAK